MRTQTHSHIDATRVRPLVAGQDYDVEDWKDLSRIGIYGLDSIINGPLRSAGFGMDTIQQPVTTPSIPTVVQFLQNWLPGNVKVITAAQKIDDLVGITTAGSWEDEQIVQGFLENTGSAVQYGDLTNVPLADWNLNFVTRTVVRGELGMRVGLLEEARAARVRVNSAEEKRGGCALNLNIFRNQVGFYGYNSGNNNTYGFLNDPYLPAYVQVATGVGGYTWAQKTALEIISDLRTAFVALRTNSQDTIEPDKTPLTLAVATNCVDYLSKTTEYGYSVYQWLKEFYKNVRVVSAPQLNSANSGSNVFYVYADQVQDNSTDDMRTFVQVVPAKFQVLGVQKLAKGYEEDYSNATAGVFCKRPYAVVRYYGI